ncbi:putative mucin-associated surface protein (MASP) [Trypanosoma cruzi]|uniref:Mucin-associated surface protein (MASP), putative n=2 Tax=Trypanosoma cruzi TaxID=5693 RepID=Q4DE02_TRYCC|nr:mucin-associated surface protein (MASP), putative [Trypanosoma cruzi]EAN90755.1 mucin-associated surface protein (MASP), putative [Trypanosoma cruzi]PWV15283.1 putative mucin-associated surface protein (MASP) [Trypanosoma cruzi]RNC34591.1 mucin-associated surface protein (MASP) [Trypanosoma cruzi]|eukprot:XP_812606.1 mucin-associated surface protein (MASP) [Trypanosoma cruzi strain CL Brener]
MAMVMAGRVLLVCALCVLWCGAAEVSVTDGDVVAGGPVALGDPGVGGQSPLVNKGDGGSGGSKGDSSHESKSESLVAASGEESPALLLDEDEGRNPAEEHLRVEKEDSKGKQEESQSPPQGASPTEVNPEEALDSLPQERSLDAPEKGVITNGGGGGTANGVKDDTDQNAGLSPNNSDPTALVEPEVKQVVTPQPITTGPSPAMTVSAEETNPTASTGPQHATETTSTTSPSHSKKVPEATEKTSGNVEPNQQREETDQPDSMNNGTTSHPAETAASSTIGSDGAQNKEGKVDNGIQRPDRKEPQDGLEDRNTDDASTASETEPKSAKTDITQKNATSKSGDSDGSTAVSHTTSPLLLLVFACAAAVVAA